MTGRVGSSDQLIRFALSPEGRVVPDFSGKLPGRGAWVSTSRQVVELAVKRRAFSRAFKADAVVPGDLAEVIEGGLVKAGLSALGLARRTGDAVVGFEKVRAGLKASKFGVLIAAGDGAEDGRKKLAGLAGSLPVVALFSGEELSGALGRDVVHAAVKNGAAARRFLQAASRLQEYRTGGEDRPGDGKKE